MDRVLSLTVNDEMGGKIENRTWHCRIAFSSSWLLGGKSPYVSEDLSKAWADLWNPVWVSQIGIEYQDSCRSAWS